LRSPKPWRKHPPVDNIRIVGGARLSGTVQISGAKNAALPILCTALLADGEHVFRNVPDLRDVHSMCALLRQLGQDARFEDGRVIVNATPVVDPTAPYEQVKKMRASVLVLGPLVARYGRASVSLPGGCAIGARPIDQHLKGLEAMGATITLSHGYVHVEVPSGRLRGAEIYFDMPTVTGTENLMSAAVLASGRTTLVNAAREPEVEELARVLNKMGASIEGAGTDAIVIEGRDEPVTRWTTRSCPTASRPGRTWWRPRPPTATCSWRAPRSRTSKRWPPRCAARASTSSAKGTRHSRRRPTGRCARPTSPRPRTPAFPRTCRRSSWCSCAARRGAVASRRPSSRTASCTCRSSTAWAP
jgi:hypothetical protein